MSLKVNEICSIMEQYAPVSLSESYDNVGLMIGNSEENVSSVLVALDCTLDVIDEALDKKCNFILTHHPLLFKKPANITNETLLGRKIIKLVKNNINVYSSHTNLDSANGGINDKLVELLGFSGAEILSPVNKHKINIIENKNLTEMVGIGRIISIKSEITLSSLCNIVKDRLQIPVLRYIGQDDKKIARIAFIGGSGSDYLELCRKLGADCIITGDITYHNASDYNEMGIALIDAGHFYTEWNALKEIGVFVQSKITELGYNNLVLFSESIKDPYKTK